jgi:hypothetical protein
MQEEHGGFKQKQEVIKQEQKKENNLQAVAASPVKAEEEVLNDDLFNF